jgi:hypothetical protein
MQYRQNGDRRSGCEGAGFNVSVLLVSTKHSERKYKILSAVCVIAASAGKFTVSTTQSSEGKSGISPPSRELGPNKIVGTQNTKVEEPIRGSKIILQEANHGDTIQKTVIFITD